MHAFFTIIKGRIPAVVQVFIGALTAAGFAIPEDAASTLSSNLDLILGGVMILTAFIPGLFQKKPPQ